jgi:hypothetical protein
MVVHRWDESDRAVVELVPASIGDELTAYRPEQDELRDIVKMAKTAELGSLGRDRYMFGKNGGPHREFDRFTDRAKYH